MKNNKKTNYKKEYKRQDNEKQEEPRFITAMCMLHSRIQK